MLRLLSVVLALTSLPVAVLGHVPKCTSITTVSTQLPRSPIICEIAGCVLVGATTCAPGQLPTKPPAVATTTHGCTVSVVTAAPPACPECSTCIPPTTTTTPCVTPTTTVITTPTPTEICFCPASFPCADGSPSQPKPPISVTHTAACTASVTVERPDCGYICALSCPS